MCRVPFAGELFACLAEALSETVERPRCVDEAYRRAIVDVQRGRSARVWVGRPEGGAVGVRRGARVRQLGISCYADFQLLS